MDKADQQLIELLQANSRQSISELARVLGLNRATVQERMSRLEQRQIIQGYTIRFHPQHKQQQVRACIMISAHPRQSNHIMRQIPKINDVESLHTISGSYDLMAMVCSDNTGQLDQAIDAIMELDGVEKTLTSVILGNKFQR